MCNWPADYEKVWCDNVGQSDRLRHVQRLWSSESPLRPTVKMTTGRDILRPRSPSIPRPLQELPECSVLRSRTKKAIVTVKSEKTSSKFEIAIEEASSLKLSNAALPCPSASSSLTPEPNDV